MLSAAPTVRLTLRISPPDRTPISARPRTKSLTTGRHGWKTIIGAGQKSGIYYAFDPDTGALDPGADGQKFKEAVNDRFAISITYTE